MTLNDLSTFLSPIALREDCCRLPTLKVYVIGHEIRGSIILSLTGTTCTTSPSNPHSGTYTHNNFRSHVAHTISHCPIQDLLRNWRSQAVQCVKQKICGCNLKLLAALQSHLALSHTQAYRNTSESEAPKKIHYARGDMSEKIRDGRQRRSG